MLCCARTDWREQSRLVQARQKEVLDQAGVREHKEMPVWLIHVFEVKEWAWGLKGRKYYIYTCHCHKFPSD